METEMKLDEKKLKTIIAESLKKVLSEGMTTDNPNLEKWLYLQERIGAESMLECIFNWSSSSQIEEWLQWFEDEGYLD